MTQDVLQLGLQSFTIERSRSNGSTSLMKSLITAITSATKSINDMEYTKEAAK